MNIFYLDMDPKVAAEYHCDKHVVKMILEYGQLLSTAHRVLDGTPYLGSSVSEKRNVARWKLPDGREDILYRACHAQHPCGIWVRENIEHYRWLYNLLYLPDDVKVPGNPIEAYRNYYRVHKVRFATWKVRETPQWYK